MFFFYKAIDVLYHLIISAVLTLDINIAGIFENADKKEINHPRIT